MRVDDFDFDLPQALIALRPCVRRDEARLLVVRPQKAGAPFLEDRTIRDLPDILEGQDCLVFNDTKVIPALLHCTRTRGGAQADVDINLHKRLNENRFAAFARPAKRLKAGDQLVCGELTAEVNATGQEGEIELSFPLSGTALDQAIASAGTMPLPPYIAGKRDVDARDRSDYQTIFAAHEGAVAAPTAGLHFTPQLMDRLAQKGISKAMLTLHVGACTFLPVKAQDTQDHRMHGEWAEISPSTADAVNKHRLHGRIVAVGTTSLRSLESAADEQGRITPFKGETQIFILPGHRIKSADILMTNFHLPRSTLFMLVCAFSGISVMKAAYAHAIEKGYRFYSYGDACLLFPQSEPS